MNSTIKNIAEQSGAFYASGFEGSELCLVDELIEKFAENIIAEYIQRLTDANLLTSPRTVAVIATEMFKPDYQTTIELN